MEKIVNQLDYNENRDYYYGKNSHLNYSDFKKAKTTEYKDNQGRLYRIALRSEDKFSSVKENLFIIDSLNGSYKFNVKIPKNSKWFDLSDLDKEMLIFSKDSIQNVRVIREYKQNNLRKTGFCYLIIENFDEKNFISIK